ncbi:MAG: MFS transporter [Proteobacteria bacterium]|nr:MFS transporter [Pseudomonadota bacterium]MBU1742762.1 MFS transporter [Pseudomonadota bacterium]
MSDKRTGMGLLKYRYIVFGILGTAYILVNFHRLCPAVVAVDMMRDLKAGGALMGLLASAYFYPYALMQIPAGLLSDSWGPRRSVTIFFIMAAIGSVGLGLAGSAGMAIFARVVVGLGVAMVFVPTMKILTNWFEPDKFSRMTGVFISLGGLGGYMAATPLAWLSEGVGWRGSMMVIGGVTMLIALAVWIWVRDTPRDKGYRPLPAASNPEPVVEAIGLLRGMGLVLKTARFWPMAICFFLGSVASLTFVGLWGGPFLMHVYGMTKPQAGAVLSMMSVGMIFGAPVMSWLSDKVFRSRKRLLIFNLIGSIVLFVFLAFFTADFPLALLYAWCFIYSFLVSGIIVVGYTTIKELFPVEISGTATGLVNVFPFAGGAVGQPLMGWYLDTFGLTGGVYGVEAYSAAFKFGLVFVVGALVAGMMVKETMPRRSN